MPKILMKRGLEASLPTLDPGEFGFCTDSYKLFIGSSDGNKEWLSFAPNSLTENDTLIYQGGVWLNLSPSELTSLLSPAGDGGQGVVNTGSQTFDGTKSFIDQTNHLGGVATGEAGVADGHVYFNSELGFAVRLVNSGAPTQQRNVSFQDKDGELGMAADIPTSYKSLLTAVVAGNLNTSQTYYLTPGMMANPDATERKVPVSACVVDYLRMSCITNGQTGGAGVVVTLRKNGVDTALTCTLTTGNTIASDTSHSVSFSDGDLLSIKVVTTTGSTLNSPSFSVRVNVS